MAGVFHGPHTLRLLAVILVLFAVTNIPAATWTAEAGKVSEGTVVVDGAAEIATTNDNFICAGLDWWPSEKCNSFELFVQVSALLWNQLMGPKVLWTNFIGTKNIRVYSHCARPSQGITLVLLNRDPYTTTKATVKGKNFEQRQEYHLTAEAGNLHSQTVLLNGEPLNLNSDGSIPALTPNEVDGSQPIKLAPHSIIFAHFPDSHAPACQ